MLLLGHSWELVLKAQVLIGQAAGIEKPLEGQPALGVPGAQLGLEPVQLRQDIQKMVQQTQELYAVGEPSLQFGRKKKINAD